MDQDILKKYCSVFLSTVRAEFNDVNSELIIFIAANIIKYEKGAGIYQLFIYKIFSDNLFKPRKTNPFNRALNKQVYYNKPVYYKTVLNENPERNCNSKLKLNPTEI